MIALFLLVCLVVLLLSRKIRQLFKLSICVVVMLICWVIYRKRMLF